jgi:hypothetical protein
MHLRQDVPVAPSGGLLTAQPLGQTPVNALLLARPLGDLHARWTTGQWLWTCRCAFACIASWWVV